MAESRPLPAVRPAAPLRPFLPPSVGLPARRPSAPLVRAPSPLPAVRQPGRTLPGRPAPRPSAPTPTRPVPRPRPAPLPQTEVAAEGQVERPSSDFRPPAWPGAASREVCDCPMCGLPRPLEVYERGPYDAQLWEEQVGGPVRPGRVHVSPSGRVTDHSANTRGSIVRQGMWDGRLVAALEAEFERSARRILRLAQDGNLVTPGEDRG